MTETKPKPAPEAMEVVSVGTVVSTRDTGQVSGRSLSADEINALRGGKESSKRNLWYVALDDSGKPTGGLMDVPPETGAYISVSNVVPRDVPSLVTPSGAPITDNMNPAHSHFDAALAARNPVPEKVVHVGDRIERNSNLKAAASGSSKSAQPASGSPKSQPAAA